MIIGTLICPYKIKHEHRTYDADTTAFIVHTISHDQLHPIQATPTQPQLNSCSSIGIHQTNAAAVSTHRHAHRHAHVQE